MRQNKAVGDITINSCLLFLAPCTPQNLESSLNCTMKVDLFQVLINN